ncbi:MAG: SUF system NifU family Fe-S cluster assembly protein [SAR324 cluster bacterium]|jgi:nitrogen fixation NifU-like protein|nr:SUF system NifU family Fe-S cluster assembly protein [SAR324 cluster bacterium]MED6339633.1 SUF system NifU family Fe-S cluster assembly protein [SAR324 cluster bacterium]PQM55669.1 MAG: SUF system NifU family Fe-S cluster assembly protein [Deltaproteobacteria bacterium]|tara:strand:- start:368 stop:796 length:429 start_codon:yes stop_codon:yes gene_type:complete
MTKPSIYRDLLLEHARHPNNCGRLESPDLRATAFNPLCGDELELTLAVSEDIIQDCKTKVRGCSICQASASMMSDLILTKTLQEAEKISKVFTESLTKENEVISESLDSLRPLIALKKHRSRIKCMKLAWDALEDCARQNQT